MADIENTLLKDIQHKKDLKFRSGTGDLDTVSGLANIKDAIIRRVITNPGELIHRPDYGAGLLKYQGVPLTLAAKQEIARLIDNNLKRESRVRSLKGVSFDNEDLTPSQVIITIRADIIGYGETDVKFAPFQEVY